MSNYLESLSCIVAAKMIVLDVMAIQKAIATVCVQSHLVA